MKKKLRLERQQQQRYRKERIVGWIQMAVIVCLNIGFSVAAQLPWLAVAGALTELVLIEWVRLTFKNWAVHVLCGTAIFIITFQTIVSYTAGSYLTQSMITSVFHPIDNPILLMLLWSLGALVLGLLCFWQGPLTRKNNKQRRNAHKLVWIGLLIAPLYSFLITQYDTPLISLGKLGVERATLEVTLYRVKHNQEKNYFQFYQGKVKSGKSTSFLSRKKNVIIVFTEGLSAEVLDQNNQLALNLTPNLTQFASESISFSNYYNHSAPTGRGLRGQLYSGYQYYLGHEKGYGLNQVTSRYKTPYISLPTILNDQNYQTEFIHAPTSNRYFSQFLGTIGFQTVTESERNASGKQDDALEFQKVLTDAENYQSQGKNFMIGMYNFGTHYGQNATEDTYGDGSNAILNKFHHYDANFGKFLAAFKASPLYDDTILIVTSDHATYPDGAYKQTFHSSQQYFVNQIPLMIYGKGLTPKVIDAKGRNSLALAPTVLDLLDSENAGNYFLGTTLFRNQPTAYEYYSTEGYTFYRTKGARVRKLVAPDQTTKKILYYMKYFDDQQKENNLEK